MDLHAPPFDRKVELLFQLFDDALADKAEGSDVVGEDFNVYGHGTPSSLRQLRPCQNNTTFRIDLFRRGGFAGGEMGDVIYRRHILLLRLLSANNVHTR
jgi:hypothetical protein